MSSKDLHGFFNPKLSKYLNGSLKKKKPKPKKKQSYKDFLLFDASSKQFFRSNAWHWLKQDVYETYPRVCMCCGDNESQMHVDHIQPRSKAPELGLTFNNLQVLCEDCNMEKSNIHAEDYREKAASEELDRELLTEAGKWF